MFQARNPEDSKEESFRNAKNAEGEGGLLSQQDVRRPCRGVMKTVEKCSLRSKTKIESQKGDVKGLRIVLDVLDPRRSRRLTGTI